MAKLLVNQSLSLSLPSRIRQFAAWWPWQLQGRQWHFEDLLAAMPDQHFFFLK